MRSRVARTGLQAVMVAVIAVVALAADQPPLIHQGVVDASVDEVWLAFTSKDGLESWMAAHAAIDLRLGGSMMKHYDPKGTLGDSKTIENTILAFEPKRMLSFRVSKPPEGFPFPRAVKNMWTVIYFEPLNALKTQFREVGLGFGDDEESQKMREFFDRGNAATLAQLQKHFSAKGPAR
jgi:uncharacterized protein YndB with AHSA1/START domain